MEYKESETFFTRKNNKKEEENDISNNTMEYEYMQLFEQFKENIATLDIQIIQRIKELIEISIPSNEVVDNSSIIPATVDAITKNTDEDVLCELYQLLTCFTAIEYRDVLDNEFFGWMVSKIIEPDEYIVYVLYCFLNIYTSSKREFIDQNFDFLMLKQFFNPEGDITTIETCIDIYTEFIKDGIDQAIAREICDFVLPVLAFGHSELMSPCLFLIVNILNKCEGSAAYIYSEGFVQRMNLMLYDTLPEIICPSFDIVIFMIKKDLDMSEVDIKNIICHLTKSNAVINKKAIEFLELFMQKYTDGVQLAFRNGLLENIKECFEVGNFEVKYATANFVFDLFNNLDDPYVRRMIREGIFDLVFDWADYDNENIRDLVLPIINKVLEMAQIGTRLEEYLEIFDSHDGADVIETIIESSTHKEEVEALANSIKDKYVEED